MTLHEFLTTNRDEILRRARASVAMRIAPQPTPAELTVGVPLFFDELVAILRNGGVRNDAIDRDAVSHGERRQQMGFTVAQVVHDYGDLCQVVTQLAIEMRAPIGTEDFKTLNRCLDNAIAQAVTEHARVRERSISDDERQRLGFFAHELRNHLQTASLSFAILQSGTVAIGGSTGAVLGRSLEGLSALIDRTLAQVRLDAGAQHDERVEIAPFLEEIEAAGVIAAREREMRLSVERGEAGVAVEADRQLLASALSNLLQNALKFSRAGGHVRLHTIATADRVTIEVHDECGGLTPQQLTELFEGLHHHDADQSGLGLGLMICKRAVEAMRGTVRARNHADVGCVFTIELPRLRSVVPRSAPARSIKAT